LTNLRLRDYDYP